jgi:hypothetical protein
MRESKLLSTLGFGIPNLMKFGKVGYFPEEFLEDFGLNGLNAFQIKCYFRSKGMDIDGDVIGEWSDKTKSPELLYFVNMKDNIFRKYIMDGSLDGVFSSTEDVFFNYPDKTDDDKKER